MKKLFIFILSIFLCVNLVPNKVFADATIIEEVDLTSVLPFTSKDEDNIYQAELLGTTYSSFEQSINSIINKYSFLEVMIESPSYYVKGDESTTTMMIYNDTFKFGYVYNITIRMFSHDLENYLFSDSTTVVSPTASSDLMITNNMILAKYSFIAVGGEGSSNSFDLSAIGGTTFSDFKTNILEKAFSHATIENVIATYMQNGMPITDSSVFECSEYQLRVIVTIEEGFNPNTDVHLDQTPRESRQSSNNTYEFMYNFTVTTNGSGFRNSVSYDNRYINQIDLRGSLSNNFNSLNGKNINDFKTSISSITLSSKLNPLSSAATATPVEYGGAFDEDTVFTIGHTYQVSFKVTLNEQFLQYFDADYTNCIYPKAKETSFDDSGNLIVLYEFTIYYEPTDADKISLTTLGGVVYGELVEDYLEPHINNADIYEINCQREYVIMNFSYGTPLEIGNTYILTIGLDTEEGYNESSDLLIKQKPTSKVEVEGDDSKIKYTYKFTITSNVNCQSNTNNRFIYSINISDYFPNLSSIGGSKVGDLVKVLQYINSPQYKYQYCDCNVYSYGWDNNGIVNADRNFEIGKQYRMRLLLNGIDDYEFYSDINTDYNVNPKNYKSSAAAGEIYFGAEQYEFNPDSEDKSGFRIEYIFKVEKNGNIVYTPSSTDEAPVITSENGVISHVDLKNYVPNESNISKFYGKPFYKTPLYALKPDILDGIYEVLIYISRYEVESQCYYSYNLSDPFTTGNKYTIFIALNCASSYSYFLAYEDIDNKDHKDAISPTPNSASVSQWSSLGYEGIFQTWSQGGGPNRAIVFNYTLDLSEYDGSIEVKNDDFVSKLNEIDESFDPDSNEEVVLKATEDITIVSDDNNPVEIPPNVTLDINGNDIYVDGKFPIFGDVKDSGGKDDDGNEIKGKIYLNDPGDLIYDSKVEADDDDDTRQEPVWEKIEDGEYAGWYCLYEVGANTKWSKSNSGITWSKGKDEAKFKIQPTAYEDLFTEVYGDGTKVKVGLELILSKEGSSTTTKVPFVFADTLTNGWANGATPKARCLFTNITGLKPYSSISARAAIYSKPGSSKNAEFLSKLKNAGE